MIRKASIKDINKIVEIKLKMFEESGIYKTYMKLYLLNLIAFIEMVFML